MNRKITQNEFKKWSQELKGIYDLIKKTPYFLSQSETEKKKYFEAASLVVFYTERGNLWATTGGLIGLELLGIANSTEKLAILSGLTFLEWENKLIQRIKEHCAANGYYNPASPSDLKSLIERKAKLTKILDDETKLYELLPYADKEEYENITGLVNYGKTLKKMGLINEGEDDPAREEALCKMLGFLIEDHVGRIEKLISKKEAAEKKNTTSSASNTSNPKSSLEYKNNLEEEIKRLQEQIEKLESKINNTDNSAQKEIHQKMLDNIKKDLEDKQKKKDKLDDKQKASDSSNKSNNKLNWAIDLGIGAIVIGLICLILLASRKKER